MADGAAVPSPCVDICRMSTVTGLCEGCARTIEEIGAWSVMSDDDKRAVWVLLPERHQRHEHVATASGVRPT